MGRLLSFTAFGALSVAVILSVVYLSLYSQENLNSEKLTQEKKIDVSFAADPGEVLNATYSAIPAIKDGVVAQKATPKPTTQAQSNVTITQKGDHLLVLVNKSIALPSSFVPQGLVSLSALGVPSYSGAQLRKEAADNLVTMFNDAKTAGYNLLVTSAYRSYSHQVATFNYWVKTVGLEQAVQVSARPGHSQHQLGTAVDLSATNIPNNLSTGFGLTPEGIWLAANSYKYGYALSYPAGKESITGYSYEPWHFRYIGVGAATQMHSLGWDLETYLQKYGVW